MRQYIIAILFVLVGLNSYAQDRIAKIKQELTKISEVTPGLNDTVNFSVTGVSIQEFLRGLAETSDLNISINPTLDVKVYNNFTNEKVFNIILFLCKEYDLDIRFVGSIMSFDKYKAEVKPLVKKSRPIKITYEQSTDKLSLDLRNDTLSAVVKKITQLSGKNVVLSPKVSQQQKVNVYLQKVTFEQAIDKLAFTNGLVLDKTKDNFFVLEPVEKEETTSSNRRGNNRKSRGQSQAGGFELLEESALVVKDSLGKKFINLTVIDEDIVKVLNAVSQEAGENYYLFSAPTGKTTIKIEDALYEDFLGMLLQGTEHTYKKDEEVYLIGERIKEGFRNTKVVTLQFRSLEEVASTIPTELKRGVEVTEFPELNSFILSGSLLQITEIESFIKAIDKTVPMVTIEVIMVEVRRGKTLKTGINAGVGDSSTTSGGTLLPGIDFTLSTNAINNILDKTPFNLGKVSPRFYVQLSALDQQENINVRSMPKLATLNGHEANLSVGQTRYYSVEQQNFVGSLNPNLSVTQQWQSVQADLSIDIKPVVSGDNQVTLDIGVEVSDFLGEPQNNAPPNSTTSQFTSMIRVGNEEMVMLGGIERIEKSESGEGTPFLSRIPIIKWFFSKRTKSKKKSIFIVFIKPTVVN